MRGIGGGSTARETFRLRAPIEAAIHPHDQRQAHELLPRLGVEEMRESSVGVEPTCVTVSTHLMTAAMARRTREPANPDSSTSHAPQRDGRANSGRRGNRRYSQHARADQAAPRGQPSAYRGASSWRTHSPWNRRCRVNKKILHLLAIGRVALPHVARLIRGRWGVRAAGRPTTASPL